ncbi:MAG: hypothetical protein R3D98_10880 [Candidatus Krumholzibacteriia bacterium]
MRIDPVGAQPRGAFIAGVRDGDVVSVDLADESRFQELLHYPVRYPAGAGSFSASVIAEPDEASLLSMVIDQVSGDDGVPAQVDLYSPQTGFHHLATTLMHRSDADAGLKHFLSLGGPPPEAMELMAGAFRVSEGSGRSTFTDVDPDWSDLMMTWQSQADALSTWQLRGKAPRNAVVLPPVPLEVTERFPGCLRENYSLFAARVGRTRSEDGAVLWMVRSEGFLSED